MSSNPDSYVCDTIPAPRFAPVSSPPTPLLEPSLKVEDTFSQMSSDAQPERSPTPSLPSSRKLCVRHQRMADEGTNLKLQQVRILARPVADTLRSGDYSSSTFIVCSFLPYSRSMHYPYPSEKLSMLSGQTSLLLLIPDEPLFCKVFSPCVASHNCPC